MKKRKQTLNKRKMLIAQYNPLSRIAEQYRIIRTNIQFSSIDTDIRSIVVTSAAPSEGKSTTIANLAVVTAQQEKKVLLIDADLRRPSIHTLFGTDNGTGLTNVLTSNYSLEEAVTLTNVKNLDVLTSGPIPPNPSELLGSQKMARFIEDVQHTYDLVLIDSPPILHIADAQVLANLCDGSMLVLKSGQTKKEEAVRAKTSLSQCKAKLLGAVLNQKKNTKADVYFSYSS